MILQSLLQVLGLPDVIALWLLRALNQVNVMHGSQMTPRSSFAKPTEDSLRLFAYLA